MPNSEGSSQPSLSVEVAASRAVCRWDAAWRKQVNFADENLTLSLVQGSERRILASYQVNHLSAKQLVLEPGPYRVELARTQYPEIVLQTHLSPTPQVSWIKDSPGSQVVIWGDLDWASIQRDVERHHGLEWDTHTKVSLKVVWEDNAGNLSANWLPVPEKDHATLHGRVHSVELAVLHSETSAILTSLLVAKRIEGAILQVLAAHEFAIQPARDQLILVRETVEMDTLQISAHWSLDAGKDLRLALTRNGVEIQAQTRRAVESSGDWSFHNLEAGTYVAHLYAGKGRKPVLTSSELVLVDSGNRIVTMPVNETTAFAYWHVSPQTWTELQAKHGDLMGRVRCHLKVYQEYNGQFWLKPEYSPVVNLNMTRDYYLSLPPDRIYKTRLVAVIDGIHEEPLSEQSNPCQLGRSGHGTNPLSHKWQPQNLQHPTIRPLRCPQNTSRHSVGHLIVHLHAHLPFIAEPVNFTAGDTWRPQGYPQEWYPEAVRETYLPLLDLFETLLKEGVDFKLSMDISPSLVAMMKSQRHAADVLEYLERLIQLARLEVERTWREEPQFTNAARMHLRHLSRSREVFLSYGGDLAEAFKRFQDLGVLELCTCIGTHAMLPLWTSIPESMRGQALAAAAYHEEVFGRPSIGVWLPECAYTPGIEPVLEEAGFRYIFTDAKTVLCGDSSAEFGVNAPVYLKGSRVAAFARDPETSEQVWSGEEGYPGDSDYLEFHIRGGPFKYNRITDRRGGWKQPYNPDWAERKAASHAGHFMFCRNSRFEYLRHVMWKKPVIVAPYDAELFGHHWYEGPRFLYYLFKKLHHDQKQTELITPAAYLAANPTAQDMFANTSSWGANATFEKWMLGDVSWMYRHSHEAARKMGEMAQQTPGNELERRILTQAARELMLSMSSDLPFVISNGHFVDRMKDAFFTALRDFWRLADMLEQCRAGKPVDEEYLRNLELEQCIFPDLKPEWFARG